MDSGWFFIDFSVCLLFLLHIIVLIARYKAAIAPVIRHDYHPILPSTPTPSKKQAPLQTGNVHRGASAVRLHHAQ